MGLAIKINGAGEVLEIHKSVHTPDYEGDPSFLINPEVSEDLFIAPNNFKWDGTKFVEKPLELTQSELAAKKELIRQEAIKSVQIPLKELLLIIIDVLVENQVLDPSKVEAIKESYAQKAGAYLSSLH